MSSLCSYSPAGKYNQFSRDTTQDQYGFIPGRTKGPIGWLAWEVLNQVGQQIKKAQTRPRAVEEAVRRENQTRGNKVTGVERRKRKEGKRSKAWNKKKKKNSTGSSLYQTNDETEIGFQRHVNCYIWYFIQHIHSEYIFECIVSPAWLLKKIKRYVRW